MKQTQRDGEDGDEEEISLWHVRYSQLTCKIVQTGTNANSADLLALKNREGFSNELTLTMVGCPEQGEYTVCALNGTMCESQKESCEVKTQDPPGCLPLCRAEPQLLQQHKADQHHYSPLIGNANQCRPILNANIHNSKLKSRSKMKHLNNIEK